MFRLFWAMTLAYYALSACQQKPMPAPKPSVVTDSLYYHQQAGRQHFSQLRYAAGRVHWEWVARHYLQQGQGQAAAHWLIRSLSAHFCEDVPLQQIQEHHQRYLQLLEGQAAKAWYDHLGQAYTHIFEYQNQPDSFIYHFRQAQALSPDSLQADLQAWYWFCEAFRALKESDNPRIQACIDSLQPLMYDFWEQDSINAKFWLGSWRGDFATQYGFLRAQHAEDQADTALLYYRRLAYKCHVWQDSFIQSNTYQRWAILVLGQNQIEQAEQLLQQSLSFLQATDTTTRCFLHDMLATLYREKKDQASFLAQIQALDTLLPKLQPKTRALIENALTTNRCVHAMQDSATRLPRPTKLYACEQLLQNPLPKEQRRSYELVLAQYHALILQQPQQARNYYQRNVVPNYSDGENLSAYLGLAQLAAADKDFKAALEQVQAALRQTVVDWQPSQVTDLPSITQIHNVNASLEVLLQRQTYLFALYQADSLSWASALNQGYRLTHQLAQKALASALRDKDRWNIATLLRNTEVFDQALSFYQKRCNEDTAAQAQVLDWMELHQALALRASLRSGQSQRQLPPAVLALKDSLDQQLQYQERRWRQSKVSASQQEAKAQWISLRLRLDSLDQAWQKAYPAYAQSQQQSPLPKPQAIQQALAKGTALVCFLEQAKHTWLLWIDDQSFRLHKREHNARYQAHLSNLLQTLHQFNTADWLPAAWGISQHLFPDGLSSSTQRLILIPDGQLAALPFEVLMTEEPKAKGRIPYWLRQLSIQYQYALSLWWQQQQAPASTGTAGLLAMAATYEPSHLTVGDSLDRRAGQLRQELAPLPGAKKEVEHLAQTFQGHYCYGQQADEAQFKSLAPRASVLHLAMHGILDQLQPERSALAFTNVPNNREDDLLQAYEIQHLNLKADLVVLSACETGRGRYQMGEGVLSLGRNFTQAGAASVVMSLWTINDEATLYLIQDFYAGLARGLAKDEALRQAKLLYLDRIDGQAAHPSYWAALVQVGDPRPLSLLVRGQSWSWYVVLVFVLVVLAYLGLRVYRRRVS